MSFYRRLVHKIARRSRGFRDRLGVGGERVPVGYAGKKNRVLCCGVGLSAKEEAGPARQPNKERGESTPTRPGPQAGPSRAWWGGLARQARWAAACGVERGKLGLGQFPGAFPFFFPNPFSKRVLGKTIKDKNRNTPQNKCYSQHECKSMFLNLW